MEDLAARAQHLRRAGVKGEGCPGRADQAEFDLESATQPNAAPRFKVHFTPTHASWMNLVEVWFSLVERQAVKRGVFKSVPDPNAKLRAYIEGWNKRAHPFVWTKTAAEILKKANRPTTSNPRH